MTTLAVQLARTTAAGGHTTRLVCAREDAQSVRELLLAAEARVPLHRLRTARTRGDDMERLAIAAQTLDGPPLRIDAATPSADVTRPDVVLNDPAPRLLVVDDLDLWARGPTLPLLRRLRALARDNRIAVVATSPAAVAAAGSQPGHDWTRLADHILTLARPDMLDHGSGRSGEIDLTLHRGTASEPLAANWFQGHYARIVDRPAAILRAG